MLKTSISTKNLLHERTWMKEIIVDIVENNFSIHHRKICPQ